MSGLKVNELKREFVDSKTNQTYPDPNSAFTPEQVKDFLSNQYPHLLNAEIDGPHIKSNKIVYNLKAIAGTKG